MRKSQGLFPVWTGCGRAAIILVGIFATAVAAEAQAAPAPGAAVARGFSSQILVTQLSLYLPEDATKGMYRGFGPAGAGRGGQGAQAGQGAQGGQSAQGGQGAQAGPGDGATGATGRGFPQIQFKRDPALYLTKDQISKLLPLLTALRESPLPTPSRARQVQADVDAILTDAQKAEWAEFQKKLQAVADELRQRMSANGPGAQGGSQQPTLLQRRQRQLDAFITVLQDRLKQVST